MAKAKPAKPARPKPTPPKPKQPRPPAARIPPSAEVLRLAAAVAAAPDDLDLQLIYADALIVQGGEHAIRGELVTLALSDKSKKVTEPRRIKLAAMLEEILAGDALTQQVVGGFVGTWTCTADEYIERAAAVFASEPLLHQVEMQLAHDDAELQANAIAETPELRRIRRLAIVGHKTRSGRLEWRGLSGLMRSKNWPTLEALRLPWCAIEDDGARLLADSRSLHRLRELDLTQNDIHSKGVIALACSPHLGELRRLVLESNKPGIAGVRAIANTKHLMKLEHVNMARTWLSANDVAPISERFPGAVVR
jgi:uncharacterized protein (TIGR02996 family)